jgi:hypothetical protein
MKYILVSALFLMCTLSSFAQEKKDAKITVTVKDTINLFNRVALALYEKGYSLANKDSQAGFIATDEKPVPKTAGSMKIRALVKDSTITFTGLMAIDVEMKILGTKLERTFDPVTFWGEKNGSYKICWREMESIAKQFGDKITYSK